MLSGSVGTDSAHPFGFVPADGPACTIASTMIATTVVLITPSRIAARTRRATRTVVISSPITNTNVGHDAIEFSMPRLTGTVVPAASEMRRTKPESTSPMNAMKSPIPTAIAAFSSGGTALNTAVRNPEAASSTMITPSTTTRPIASGQLMIGASVTATSELIPSPVAIANG